MAPAPRPLPEGGFNFTYQPSVADLNINARAFVSARPLIAAAATGALVFSRATGEDRVLLIQRAPHDSLPLLWEVPGGACDWEDESIFHGVARELWEEAGLKMTNVVRTVGKEEGFLMRNGLAVAKTTFEVEVETPKPTESAGGHKRRRPCQRWCLIRTSMCGFCGQQRRTVGWGKLLCQGVTGRRK